VNEEEIRRAQAARQELSRAIEEALVEMTEKERAAIAERFPWRKPPEDPGGSSGVREPRRPRPQDPSTPALPSD
jgi:hypothetical protein